MPAKIQGGWLDALQHVFLHSDAVSSPTVVFFAPEVPIPAASLGRAQGEGAKLTAQGRSAADGDGKETFNSGSPDFCWEQNGSSTRTGWLSPWLRAAAVSAAETRGLILAAYLGRLLKSFASHPW